MNNTFISPYPPGYKTPTELSFEITQVQTASRLKSKTSHIKAAPQVNKHIQTKKDTDLLWKLAAAFGIAIISVAIIYQLINRREENDRDR